jgi:hypothetical protein
MPNTLVPDFDILQVGIRICISVDPDYKVSYGFRLIDSAGFGFSLGLAADR